MMKIGYGPKSGTIAITPSDMQEEVFVGLLLRVIACGGQIHIHTNGYEQDKIVTFTPGSHMDPAAYEKLTSFLD